MSHSNIAQHSEYKIFDCIPPSLKKKRSFPCSSLRLSQFPFPIPSEKTRESTAHCTEKKPSFWTDSLHPLQGNPPFDLFLGKRDRERMEKGEKKVLSSSFFYFKVCFS
jgi:hypothetical protein